MIEPTNTTALVSSMNSGVGPGSDLINLPAKNVVGRSATRAIVPYVYMRQSGLVPNGRPAGVFLLLGPTGTGKTKTVAADCGSREVNSGAGIETLAATCLGSRPARVGG